MMPSRPRLIAELALPASTYVPGPTAQPPHHLLRDWPELAASPLECPESNAWPSCSLYLFALDLFNHGYYWEAHEAWEALWNACGRKGPQADFFKGLIQLAVAGVKVRENRPIGIRSHALRAAELFRALAPNAGEHRARWMGLHLHDLIEWSQRAADTAPQPATGPSPLPLIVFDFRLLPE